MSSLGGLASISPLTGKGAVGFAALTPGAPLDRHGIGATTARPAAAVSAPLPSKAISDEEAAAAARRQLVTAVKNAALAATTKALVAQAVSGDSGPKEAGKPRQDTAPANEIIARITEQILPVLPEPATPARSAFAEAVVAMRLGLTSNGDLSAA